MNLKPVLKYIKTKRFIAAAALTALTLAVIFVQKPQEDLIEVTIEGDLLED